MIKFKNKPKWYDIFGLFKTQIHLYELYKYDILIIWECLKNEKFNFLNVLKPIFEPTTCSLYNKYLHKYEDISGFIFVLHVEKIRFDKKQILGAKILIDDFKPLYTIGKIFIKFIQTIIPEIIQKN